MNFVIVQNLGAKDVAGRSDVFVESPMDGLHVEFDQPGLSQCHQPSPFPRLRLAITF